MKLTDLLQQSEGLLETAGVPNPRVDAELLLAHVLGENRGTLRAKALAGLELSTRDVQRANELVRRRAQRVPLQHLTETAFFRHLELRVGPGVFVPRPETEVLVDIALAEAREQLATETDELLVVDLCTGSGAIALSLATELAQFASDARVFAVELSEQAVAYARENASSYPEARVEIVSGDARTALPTLDSRVHLVVSNPPYIPEGAVPRDPEVRDHDPALALYSGADGLDLVRAISVRALELLRSGGVLLLEHGEFQADEICALLKADGWRAVRTERDLTGRDRVTVAFSPTIESNDQDL